MPFEKGKPRAANAGRKLGTPNKATLAEQACIKLGIHPFELLAAKAAEGDMNAIIQLCKHIEPPRKPLDVALDPEANKIEVIIKRYSQ